MGSIEYFKRRLQDLETLTRMKISVRTPHPNFSPFEQFSTEQQTLILQFTENLIQILKELHQQKEDWLDSRKALQAACKILNLQPNPNLLDQIEPDDLVEIYSRDGYRLFYSFNLFLNSHHPLETLLCCSWDQLIERDPAITHLIWKKLQSALESGGTQTHSWNIDSHILYEICRGKKYPFQFKPKLLSIVSADESSQSFISIASLRKS